MKNFLIYFFGQGTEAEYANFTFAHFAPIAAAVCVIFLLRRCRHRLRGWKHEELLRYILAFTLIITDMSYYWRLAVIPSLGGNVAENLPIGVCCWSVIFCSYMVIGKTQTLFDIVYFWLFSGSLFALITPTVLPLLSSPVEVVTRRQLIGAECQRWRSCVPDPMGARALGRQGRGWCHLSHPAGSVFSRSQTPA